MAPQKCGPEEVPPLGEGMNVGQELGPYQEPGACRKARQGRGREGGDSLCALHRRAPCHEHGHAGSLPATACVSTGIRHTGG
jgi:hypothetical protein